MADKSRVSEPQSAEGQPGMMSAPEQNQEKVFMGDTAQHGVSEPG